MRRNYGSSAISHMASSLVAGKEKIERKDQEGFAAGVRSVRDLQSESVATDHYRKNGIGNKLDVYV